MQIQWQSSIKCWNTLFPMWWFERIVNTSSQSGMWFLIQVQNSGSTFTMQPMSVNRIRKESGLKEPWGNPQGGQRIPQVVVLEFIQEQRKSTEEPEKLAEFLDQKGKHKQSVELNSLEASETKSKRWRKNSISFELKWKRSSSCRGMQILITKRLK